MDHNLMVLICFAFGCFCAISVVAYAAYNFMYRVQTAYAILVTLDKLISMKYDLVMKIKNFHTHTSVETMNSALEELDKLDKQISLYTKGK